MYQLRPTKEQGEILGRLRADAARRNTPIRFMKNSRKTCFLEGGVHGHLSWNTYYNEGNIRIWWNPLVEIPYENLLFAVAHEIGHIEQYEDGRLTTGASRIHYVTISTDTIDIEVDAWRRAIRLFDCFGANVSPTMLKFANSCLNTYRHAAKLPMTNSLDELTTG